MPIQTPPSLTLHDIARALDGIPSGAGYLCRCPAHDDKHRSLSLNPGRNKPIVAHCHAKCPQSSVIDSLKAQHLWPDASGFTARPSRLDAQREPDSPDGWVALAPVPDDAPAPPERHNRFGAPTVRYRYLDANGALLQLIDRHDTDDGKQFCPLVFAQRAGERRWVRRQLLNPRPLYGLEHMTDRLLVVEGEKAADAANGRLSANPDTTAITWSGGSSNASAADWSPVSGCHVMVWPDNDEPGRKAARDVAALCHRAGAASVQVLQPPLDSPKGWDAADATAEEFEAVLRGPVAPPPADLWDLVRPVGHQDGKMAYWSTATASLRLLQPDAHRKHSLLALAPDGRVWERAFPGQKCRVDWDAAAESLMHRATAAGAFTPDHVRGRGAHLSPDLTIHLGNRVHPYGPPGIHDGRVYESATTMPDPWLVEPATDEECAEILSILQTLNWREANSPLLLAGWIALAPLCGALPWRPHLWLTARQGAGKSSVMELIVRPLLAGHAINIDGDTTEAGIRQQLRHDSLPVVFDEAEGDDTQRRGRIASLIQFIRQCSAPAGGRIIKGTTHGRPIVFHCRSSFCLSSIAVPLLKAADASRILQIHLDAPMPTREWQTLRKRIKATITTAMGLRLLRRVVDNWDRFTLNQATFATVAGDTLASQRLGDQFGTLAAGYLMLTPFAAATLTEGQAQATIDRLKLTGAAVGDDDTDEQACLTTILQIRVRVGMEERSIGELVEDGNLIAQTALKRYGIILNHPRHRLQIAVRHRDLAHALRDTPFADRWGQYLTRLPGARSGRELTPKWFASGLSRVVEIPIPEMGAADALPEM